MKSNFSRFGKPKKSRSDRKEKTESPSRSEERKGVEKVEGSDDATTQSVSDKVSPVPEKHRVDIDKVPESGARQGMSSPIVNRFFRESKKASQPLTIEGVTAENERKRLEGIGIDIYYSLVKEGKEEEWKEVAGITEELKEVQGHDIATIQGVINKARSALEPWVTEKRKQEAEQSVRSYLRQIERMLVREELDSFKNFRESLIEVKAVMEGGDVDGARKQLDLLQETEEYKVLLSRREEREQEEEVSKLLFGESRMVRDYILESQGKLPLSKEKFDLYFSSKDFDISADLKQQNVGDCYLIAAIHSMSCSPNFELFCRSSMERLSDGSWRVKIPLLSEDGEWITITQEDISPQKNEEFLSLGAEEPSKPGHPVDIRRELQPVRGKEGLQVLEAAHIKKRFSVVNRLAAEGGQGGKALMLFGGDNFVRFTIFSEVLNSGDWESRPLKKLDSEQANSLDSFLENFDPEIHMATVANRVTDDSPYRAPETGETLRSNHAYSIAGVNAEEGTITLANPWDTSRPIEMSFDQFKENFSDIDAVRIDHANLLLNMREVGR